jgi:hypothetical protein
MICVMSHPKSDYPRDLEEGYKLFARSTPEVFEALGGIVSRVGSDREIRFKGRLRPKKAQVLNAVLLHFASLPVEEQIEAVRDGMDRLNAILRQPLKTKPPAGKAGEGGSFDLGSGGRLKPITYPKEDDRGQSA